MIRRGGTTSALALGMARASRREGQGCECHPRSVRWVWVWPGVTSANTPHTERVPCSDQQSEFSLHLSACCATCASVVVIYLVLYRRNVPCHFHGGFPRSFRGRLAVVGSGPSLRLARRAVRAAGPRSAVLRLSDDRAYVKTNGSSAFRSCACTESYARAARCCTRAGKPAQSTRRWWEPEGGMWARGSALGEASARSGR